MPKCTIAQTGYSYSFTWFVVIMETPSLVLLTDHQAHHIQLINGVIQKRTLHIY